MSPLCPVIYKLCQTMTSLYLYIIPLFEILITIATPIKNIAVIRNKIPNKILNVSPICSNSFIIFSSAIGSANAVAILYVMVIRPVL